MKFGIHKLGADCVTFDRGYLYPWATYQVSVDAPEFVSDLTSACTLSLLHDSGAVKNVVFATCDLTADPLRRGLRTGTLPVGDQAHAGLFDMLSPDSSVEDFVLHITLGSDNATVVYKTVPLRLTPRVVQAGGGGGSVTSASMWTVVDGGTVSSVSSLDVGDRTQTSYVVSGASGVINIVPRISGVPTQAGPFEAYVRFSVPTSWAPLSDVTVNGESVTWDYKDSYQLESPEWMLHLMTIGGVWHASLKAGVTVPGVEEDSDSDEVPGTEVNS